MRVIEKYAVQKINLTSPSETEYTESRMKVTKLISVVSTFGILTLFSGCASFSGAESRENIQDLKSGMNQSQVLSLLGTPDSVLHESEITDRWIYEYKREDKKGHNLFVEFQHGALSRSGELAGRDVAAAEETRIPGSCTKWQRPEFTEDSLCTK